MIIGFRMEIYPTKEQEKVLFYYCKTFHNMWNFLVSKYRNESPIVSKFGIKDYTQEDLINDFGENIPKRIALGVIKRYASAMQSFYNKKSKLPKFHKYNPNKQSFYVASMSYNVKNGIICIPFPRHTKHTSRRIFLSTDYLEKHGITEVIEPIYSFCNGKWFLSGSYKSKCVEKRDKDFLGLDWGMKNFMTTSNGEFINYPKSIKREYQRIKKIKSKMDKKIKNSKNYAKLYRKFQSAHERMNNLKSDFIEKRNYSLVQRI